jgi:magnesium chelatase subunit I
MKDLVEQVAFEARKSEFIDQKSGVSARLTISAYENLISHAERRMLMNQEKTTFVRLADLSGIIPAVTGKIELVYEGELEGPAKVAHTLIGKAVKHLFARYFPDPERAKKSKTANPYTKITEWFTEGNTIDIADDLTFEQYQKALMQVDGLHELVQDFHPKLSGNQTLLLMEFVLHGLAEYSQLSKNFLHGGFGFADMFESLFNSDMADDFR